MSAMKRMLERMATFTPYYALNRLFVLAFSNERDAIALPADDRRWFVLWSHAPRMHNEEAAAMWHWYAQGGLDAVCAYLDERDVSAFNPGAAPPMTDAKHRTRPIEQVIYGIALPDICA